eukprot:TRINITY_DN7854_c0_g1_i3.p1 TRINITY_DN7854_c0_g1~~TRINITY_DN7854_c0_g1_i3.p1  ORF type:complete len:716 (-),score=96.87 TRINITY_DN7854_c0_g1_i3:163-2310(-)
MPGDSQLSNPPWAVDTSSVDPASWVSKLIRDVIHELGWRELHRTTGSSCDVEVILGSAALEERVRFGRPGGGLGGHARIPKTECWVSRFIGCRDACEKRNFALAARTARRLCPTCFGSLPPTWSLPEDLPEICSLLENWGNDGRDRGSDDRRESICRQDILAGVPYRTVIVKPGDGSQGEGIFFARSRQQLEIGMRSAGDAVQSAVAQTYVERPLLLGGLKFDLRLYICLIGLHPPRAFLCREGLARFATEPYTDPGTGAGSRWEPQMHLTNYSMNKGSPGFVANGPAGSIYPQASKRPLSILLQQLRSEASTSPYAFDEDELWRAFDKAATDMVALLVPVLRATCGHAVAAECRSFQIFGIDMLLDEEYTPWLLEVNSSPSMQVDHVRPWDETVDLKADRCNCVEAVWPHVHEACGVDVLVKGKVLGCALQLVREHAEGRQVPATGGTCVGSRASTGVSNTGIAGPLPVGDPHETYRELSGLSNHPLLRRLLPAEALWARCYRGRGLGGARGSTSVELRRELSEAWRSVLHTSLPAFEELEIFAGALRRRRFARSGSTRPGGNFGVDHAELSFWDFAELMVDLVAKSQQKLQSASEHDVQLDDPPRICEALCAALQAQDPLPPALLPPVSRSATRPSRSPPTGSRSQRLAPPLPGLSPRHTSPTAPQQSPKKCAASVRAGSTPVRGKTTSFAPRRERHLEGAASTQQARRRSLC